MKIRPIYTQLNQICDAKDTFFSLLKDYRPAFLFLSNSQSNESVYSITGRNPYITIHIKDELVNLRIGSEVFEIKSKKVGLKQIIKNIIDITLILNEETLTKEVPFHGGMVCQKIEEEIFLFFPTEIIVFDHFKNNLTAIVNTYHNEEIEDDVFFRANVKIARIIEHLKKDCKNTEKNSQPGRHKASISHIYEDYIEKIKSPFLSIFKTKNQTTISSSPESSHTTESGTDIDDILDTILNNERLIGFFNFDGSSKFIRPDMIIDKKDDKISFWSEKESDIDLLKNIIKNR